MNVSSRTLKYGLLTAAACVALGSCSKLFPPAEAEKFRTRTRRKHS